MSADAFSGALRIATVRATNWRELVRYYRDCVGLRQQFVDEASEYAMFDAGTIRLAVEGPAKPALARAPGAGALVLNFEVASLADALRGFEASGALVEAGVQHGPGYDYLALRDPEGNQHIVYERTASKR